MCQLPGERTASSAEDHILRAEHATAAALQQPVLASASPAPKATAGATITPQALGRPRCGLAASGTSCGGGMCCSADGFCGGGPAYCTTGCQADYGRCDVVALSPSPSPKPASPSPSPKLSPSPSPSPSPRPPSPSPSPTPAGCPLKDGTIAHCATTGEISYIQGGQRRWYSLQAWLAAGPPAVTFEESGGCPKMKACPDGPPMPVQPPPASPSPRPSPSPSPKPSPSPSPKPSPSPSPRPSPSPSPGPSPKPIAPSPSPKPSPSPATGGVSLGNSIATYHYYGLAGYQVSTLYCADAFAGKSQAWLMQYPWTAYCMPVKPMSQAMCGQCLRLTNLRTGAKEVVRIVDECGHNALDLDWTAAFKPLDTDGQGYLDGHMNLAVEQVAC
ncbi:hypothetical protein N2152v2_002517 [Parachlorella kessleri]